MSTEEQNSTDRQVAEAQVIRRKDLTDLGESFIQALAPVGALVASQQEAVKVMQRLNIAAECQADSTRRQTYAIWGSIFLAFVVLGTLYQVADKLNQQSHRMDEIHQNMADNVKLLKELAVAAQDTNKSVTAAEERAATQPTVQLVPELDPEKAKRAPMKLRIENPTPDVVTPEAPKPLVTPAPPKIAAPAPSAVLKGPKGATVEIPIPAESF